jgi:hypothetical protein
MRRICALLVLALMTQAALAREFHVSPKGNGPGDGSAANPFKTISAAAQAAQPGDVITVHAGIYRERVTPPRGGESEEKRITYQAAPGEEAVIKGSEVIRDWKPFKGNAWKVTIPNSFFGKYNPYQDLIVGDWFNNRGRKPHTGEVYLNGKSLYETNKLEEVTDPKPFAESRDPEGSTWTWTCESDAQNTTIYANFHGKDPNKELVEINVREACFYPDQPGRNYITIRGFRMSQAATQWAAPTAEQIGLIGTHWSKGWIIENNVISDSKCSGIALGKDRKSGHNVWINDPSKDGCTHYNEVVVRALAGGWSKEQIGSHIVRNNEIFNCEQTGICGSLGAAFSQITNNRIHHIWTKRLFAGAEIAGIKIHASIDMLIANNHIHNAGRGMWMDWMAQGVHITRNLCYDNTTDDLFCEVDHGPFLVDNNIFLSAISLNDMSEGGAYAHNLMAGRINWRPEPNRKTPYHKAHSTALAGLVDIRRGDDRFYNNIFVGAGTQNQGKRKGKAAAAAGYGLWVYDRAGMPIQAAGNVYLNGARPYAQEKGAEVVAGLDPKVKIEEKDSGVYLSMTPVPSEKAEVHKLVDSALLGRAKVPDLPYENADGTPLKVDYDYFGKPRNAANPVPGPFEQAGAEEVTLKVW